MKKKWISYKLQYCISLIPILGWVVVWLIAWLSIYKITKSKLNVFLHGVIWLLTILIFEITFVLVYSYWILNMDSNVAQQVLGIILGYSVLLACAFSCVGIEKGIIGRYKSKQKKDLL